MKKNAHFISLGYRRKTVLLTLVLSTTLLAQASGGEIVLDPRLNDITSSQPTTLTIMLPPPTSTVIGGPNASFTALLGRSMPTSTPSTIAIPGSLTTPPATPLTFLFNDLDPDGDNHQFDLPLGPFNGTSQILANNTVTYTPSANFSGGADTFFIGSEDKDPSTGAGKSYSLVAANVQVGSNANQPPSVSSFKVATQFNTPVTFHVDASDPEHDPLSLTCNPVWGSCSASPDSSGFTLTYKPKDNFYGPVPVAMVVNDGNGNSVGAVGEVDVGPPGITQFVIRDGGPTGPIIGSVTTGQYGSNTILVNLSQLTSGSHTFDFQATDGGGGTVDAQQTYIVDSTPPTCQYVTPLTPTNGSYVGGNIGLTVHAEDDLAIPPTDDKIGAVLLIEPKPGSPTKSYARTSTYAIYELLNYDTTQIPDGLQTFRTVCTDVFNNPAYIQIKLNVDNTGPSPVGIDIMPAPAAIGSDLVMNGLRTVHVTASDAGSGVASVKLYLEGSLPDQLLASAGSGDLTFSLTTPSYADGQWTLRAEATDVVGNKTVFRKAVVFDNTSPSLSIVSPADGTVGLPSVSAVQISASDLHGTKNFSLTINGQPASGALNDSGLFTLSSPISVAGFYTFVAHVEDQAGTPGNAATAQAVVALSGTNHPPVAQNQSASTLVNTAKTITLTATDADNDPLTFSIFSAPSNGSLSGTGPVVIYTPKPGFTGPDPFVFKARDASSDSNNATVSIMVTGPTASLFAQDASAETNQGKPVSVTVSVTNVQPGPALTFAVVDAPAHGHIDGNGPTFTYTPDSSFSGFDRFTYTAQQGATTSNVATVNLTVDAGNIPPTLNVISPSNGSDVHGTVPVQISATDNGGVPTVTISIDGGAPQTITSVGGVFTFPWDTSSLSNSSHTIQVVATDNANLSSTKTITVVVDNIPPTVPVFTPADGSTVSGMQGVQATVSDADGIKHADILIDGNVMAGTDGSGGSMNLNYSWNTASLPDGTHRVQVRVWDVAGNETIQEHDVLVANGALPPGGAPQFDVVAPTDKSIIGGIVRLALRLTQGPVTGVTFTVDGGAPITGSQEGTTNIYSALWDTTNGVVEGNHVIEFSAFNNVGITRVSVNVVVDNTPPDVQIKAPTSGQVLFFVENLISQVTDANLDTVVFSIGTKDIALFQASATSPLYSYAFDTQQLDSNGKTVYPDGSYQLTVTAKDKAGNKRTVSVAFTIGNANPPVSTGQTLPSLGDNNCILSPNETTLSVTFANVVIDPTQITNSSIRVHGYQGGVQVLINGTVAFANNTATFSPPLSLNQPYHIDTAFVDSTGHAVLKSWNLLAGVVASQGGVVTSLDGHLSLSLPGGALAQSACVDIELDTSNSSPSDDSDGPNGRVYAGPYKVSATARDGTVLTGLVPDQIGTLAFNDLIANEPPVVQSDVFRVEYDLNGWHALDPGTGSTVAGSGLRTAADPTQTRVVSVFIRNFGRFRITSSPAPGPGISNVYNAPNPFSPLEGDTQLHYMLGADSDVTIVIYDLLGNLVREVNFSAGLTYAHGQSDNIWPWNGKNGRGETVGNGGYIVKILATDNQGHRYTQTHKIAVAK